MLKEIIVWRANFSSCHFVSAVNRLTYPIYQYISAKKKFLKGSDRSICIELVAPIKWFSFLVSDRLTRLKSNQMSNGTYLFKLGNENNFKNYINQYTTNPLALNKPQRNEERDKKRYMSHKFSLASSQDFKWIGLLNGKFVFMALITIFVSLHLWNYNIKNIFRYKAFAGGNPAANIDALGSQYCATIYASQLDPVEKTLGSGCTIVSSTSRLFKGSLCSPGMHHKTRIYIFLL